MLTPENQQSTRHPQDSDPASDHALIKQLEQSELFRTYRDAFETTFRTQLVIQVAGASAPFPPDSASDRCLHALLAGSTQAARELDLQTLDPEGSGETRALKCDAAFIESVVPIRLGLRIVGYLRTGQVLLLPTSVGRFNRLIRRLAEQRPLLDIPRLRTAYFAAHAIPRSEYQSLISLLVIFARHLAMMGNQLMIAERSCGSPVINRACHYIDTHYGDDMTLATVAHSVHVSPYYFCKIFKRETGLTFTSHLARVRIEKVKYALLNRDTRVTEAAYEAGFQSVSQFNRVFRRIVGESPSEYRDRLIDPACTKRNPRSTA